MHSPDDPLTDLLLPPGGIPQLTDTTSALEAAIDALSTGTGPVAVDAERASGFRYGQRPFLLQLKRHDAGTWLIDSEKLPDLSRLRSALDDTEWIIHAASQDLPCLRDVNMQPPALFDTELGARIAGFPKVGLGTLTEELLGIRLAKEHSAADWSQRPLPEDWLAYAALDVEILDELREILHDTLDSQGKLDWAQQEFEAVRTARFPTERVDPWRRTSGIHRLRNSKQLAVVRAIWEEREAQARSLDRPPGKVLPDSAIVEAAVRKPTTRAQLTKIYGFSATLAAPLSEQWLAAIEKALSLPDSDYPPLHLPSSGPPPHRLWKDKNPLAAARLVAVRNSIGALSDELKIPVENILTPDLLRRVIWVSSTSTDFLPVEEQLQAAGARPWQIKLTATLINRAIFEEVRP